MERIIKCSNEDGMEVVFGNTFSPFLLEDCDGIYSVQNNVVTCENTMTDGATYQGSTTKMRNIVLTLRDHTKSDHQANRALLYNLFKPKSLGKFTYFENENDEGRSIDYYVESVEIDSVERARRATVSLLCPDPFFVGPSDLKVTLAGWSAHFEFLHEFKDEGEELGARVNEAIKTIENTSAADNIGITITVKAEGPIQNPSFYHLELAESIAIGTSGNPFNLLTGEKLIITTGTNEKHVCLEKNGIVTEINEYLSEDSEFIQLKRGLNTFGYSAETGVENMSVEISYRYQYLGV